MALTPKQQRFVEEYVLDLNATQAAIRAGYSANHADVQGPRILGYAGVKAAIDAALAKRTERTGLTADWVLDQLRENARIAREAGDIAPANRALELLGKHIGMFTERKDVTIHIDTLDAAEIERELAQLDAQERAGADPDAVVH